MNTLSCSILGPIISIFATLGIGGIIYYIIFLHSNLTDAKEGRERLEHEKSKLEEDLKRSNKKYDELQKRLIDERENMIFEYVLPHCKGNRPESIARLCVKHRDYVGYALTKPEELFKYAPEYIIKVALAAEQGLLDYYIINDMLGENFYRMDANGERIYLTDEQVDMMIDKDYSFFL
jgi:hypothetical protein